MINDKDLVEKCILELRKKTGYEDSTTIIQRDIEYLCSEIAEKTNIHISISTIKRLLNGQFSRLPQIATLNAITYYLGYDNWQDFKIKKKNANGSPFTNVNGSNGSNNGHSTHKKKGSTRFRIVGMVAAGIVVLIALLAAGYFLTGKSDNAAEASFSFRKTTNNDIPNTVVFNYNIDKLEGDSFFIQQSWDRHRKVRIYKHQYTLTDIYYEPGFHNAKLIANDKIIKTLGVSIPTNGWFFFAKDRKDLNGSTPVYIKPASSVRNGILGLQPKDLVDSHIDTLQERNYIYTWFPSTYSVSSDNCMFSARIRTKSIRDLLCPNIMLEIGCQTNFIYFHLTSKGCTSNISAQFGERYLDGKTTDLSSFGADIRQWQNVEMMIMDKKATVFINQREIFSMPYSQSSGLITGLAFVSNGLIEIDNLELTSLDGKVVFKDAFN